MLVFFIETLGKKIGLYKPFEICNQRKVWGPNHINSQVLVGEITGTLGRRPSRLPHLSHQVTLKCNELPSFGSHRIYGITPRRKEIFFNLERRLKGGVWRSSCCGIVEEVQGRKREEVASR